MKHGFKLHFPFSRISLMEPGMTTKQKPTKTKAKNRPKDDTQKVVCCQIFRTKMFGWKFSIFSKTPINKYACKPLCYSIYCINEHNKVKSPKWTSLIRKSFRKSINELFIVSFGKGEQKEENKRINTFDYSSAPFAVSQFQ